MTSEQNALLITAVDLTRSCCANENYFCWLSNHAEELQDSVAIANYLALATDIFQFQANAHIKHFDPLAARDSFADVLMASSLLTVPELQAAVTQCIQECRFEEAHT
jgi:hypothetical protein